MYQSQKILDLKLAPDGSGFFVVEPLASSTTQIRVQNLDLGVDYTVPLWLLKFEGETNEDYTVEWSSVIEDAGGLYK